MIGIGLVVGGILAAIVVIAIGATRAVRGPGADYKSLGITALVVLLVIGKFDFDPTAAECPTKQPPSPSSQLPVPRCTIGNALGYTMASGAINLESTVRSVGSGAIFTNAGRTALTSEIKDSVKKLSPVVAGVILMLACALALAAPSVVERKVAPGSVVRWTTNIVVLLACVGTLPWACGVLLAYSASVAWPATVLPFWVIGLACGLSWTVTLYSIVYERKRLSKPIANAPTP